MQELAKRDARVRVIDKPNGGYGHTMNRGLDVAKGEYVAFLESDDSINTSAYRKLAETADAHSLDIIKGDYFLLEGLGDERALEPVEIMRTKERYGKVISRSMNPGRSMSHDELPGAF